MPVMPALPFHEGCAAIDVMLAGARAVLESDPNIHDLHRKRKSVRTTVMAFPC